MNDGQQLTLIHAAGLVQVSMPSPLSMLPSSVKVRSMAIRSSPLRKSFQS